MHCLPFKICNHLCKCYSMTILKRNFLYICKGLIPQRTQFSYLSVVGKCLISHLGSSIETPASSNNSKHQSKKNVSVFHCSVMWDVRETYNAHLSKNLWKGVITTTSLNVYIFLRIRKLFSSFFRFSIITSHDQHV